MLFRNLLRNQGTLVAQATFALLALAFLLAFGVPRQTWLNMVWTAIALSHAESKTVSIAELESALIRLPALLLLDARSSKEYAVSHLKGAQHLDPEQPDLSLVGSDLERPIIVYCSVGLRSARVAQALERAGYRDVRNLAGGIFAWANSGRPVFNEHRQVRTVHPFSRVWALLLLPELRAGLAD